jgi:hypothetical protein
VESLIKEYEYSLPSLVEETEKRKSGKKRTDKPYVYGVEKIANGLFEHIKAFYDVEFQNAPIKPELGILVSGYSSGQFFPEQWLFSLPQSTMLTPVRPDKDSKPEFGAQWFGVTDAIVRLHHGRDDRLIGKLAERFKVTPQEILDLLKEFEYPVIFHGMPLQDAIDYATYMINVVIGRFRFVIGAPLCGGEIDVAVITPNAFTWVQRKSWKTNRIPIK